MGPPLIGFLTDFGLDGAAATCRGVMLSICPDARVVDISHTVRKYAVRDGAFILRDALASAAALIPELQLEGFDAVAERLDELNPRPQELAAPPEPA